MNTEQNMQAKQFLSDLKTVEDEIDRLTTKLNEIARIVGLYEQSMNDPQGLLAEECMGSIIEVIRGKQSEPSMGEMQNESDWRLRHDKEKYG